MYLAPRVYPAPRVYLAPRAYVARDLAHRAEESQAHPAATPPTPNYRSSSYWPRSYRAPNYWRANYRPASYWTRSYRTAMDRSTRLRTVSRQTTGCPASGSWSSRCTWVSFRVDLLSSLR
ncbi:hypothetical protein GCM10009804_35650 [Kribbella hippodromi]|uniref:Uncharacterized protein n=1 Tax=Kribbella hippodromi TaxID=434347 RepID=A0ABN2DH73_9ACTN